MLPELLVTLACLESKGCSPTAALYASQNPWTRTAVQNLDTFSKPFLVQYWGSFVAFAAGREGSLKLNQDLSLILNQNYFKLNVNVDF